MHLGNAITSKGFIIDIKEMITSMKSRTNTIVNNFSNTTFKSKILLFNSQCLPLYGCQLWNLSNPHKEELSVAWRKCTRACLVYHTQQDPIYCLE